MNRPESTQQSEDGRRLRAAAFARRLLPQGRGRRFAIAAGASLALAGAAAAYMAYRPPADGRAIDSRLGVRIRVMQEHLATQAAPYVILAGDSHAELLSWGRVCGKQVVNLGVGGIAAVRYGKVLAHLTPASRAEAMVVFLGTNDLAQSLKPASEKSLKRFESHFADILQTSRRFADRAVYVPLFPRSDDSRATAWLDMAEASRYRLVASAACLSSGCTPLEMDRVHVGMTEDGIHADRADRRLGGSLHTLVEQELCPDQQTGSIAPPSAKGDAP